jgi:hypothetical protein
MVTWYPLSRRAHAVISPVTPPPTIRIDGEDSTGVRRGAANGLRSLQKTKLVSGMRDFVGCMIAEEEEV